MAGTIPYSLSQQLDEFGAPLSGGKLYLIQAGTVSTPQNGYQDSALTLVLPNPIILDDAGRLPQFFLADGSIKIRLTKSNGVEVVTADGILVVGASSGGGGGSPVDATTVLATGDIKVRFGTGVLSGFVRMNGRTIGSATSGATERANADTQALFEYIWNTDPFLVVSPSVGASANADWLANKTVKLPDARGRSLAGTDDMGNSAAGVLTTATVVNPTFIGAKGGVEARAILQQHIPSYTLSSTLGISNSLGLNDPGHGHTLNNGTNVTHGSSFGTGAGTTGGTNSDITVNSNSTGITLTGTVALTGSVTSGGSGVNLSILSPLMLMTFYMKL